MGQQISLEIVHNSDFDEYGNCRSCSLHESECECLGPWDVFQPLGGADVVIRLPLDQIVLSDKERKL